MPVLTLLLGIALGALAAWAAVRWRAAAERQALEAAVRVERERAQERAVALEEARAGLENAFKALCADALRSNNESFLQLARAQLEQLQQRGASDLEQRRQEVERLVTPIRESLERFDGQIRGLEHARREAYGSLAEQLRSLAESQDRLRSETSNLVTALRAPHVRGRWGELQLKRVVEMAGMVAHCDFVEQSHATDADGRGLRPDLVVRLPGGKNVVVDAKVPLSAYLDGIEAADDDVRRLRLVEHARQVREHVTKLAAKSYWRQFAPAPDFVVLFMPDEAFYRAALEHDPSLLEYGVDAGVIPATPTTLIALLRAIAYGWQQETVAENARAISELGRELYERLGTLGRHFAKLGRSLDSAVGAYNEAVGSLETRVLVSARRFEGHGVSAREAIADVTPLERQARPLHALELTQPDDDDDAAAAVDAA
ncbi:MAG: DNA recombination protein RmuC [Thermoleophilia bacterium]|nr:DNA recombination protein RmuC [Thermoleophilia bacterium]